MHREEFEKNWNEFKGQIHHKWDKWSHEDASKINGKYEAFVNWLEKKYSYTKDQAEKEIHKWYMEGSKHNHKDSNCSCCGKEGPLTKKRGFWSSSPKKEEHPPQKNKKRKAG